MQYGFAMKVKHGNGFRRNVRFDDAEMTFCIDVKLPDDEEWASISYERACRDRIEKKKTKQARDEDRFSSAQGGASQEWEEEMDE